MIVLTTRRVRPNLQTPNRAGRDLKWGNVWEPDPDKAEITKLDPSEVMTTAQAAKLLNPLIKPLPSFDEVVHG